MGLGQLDDEDYPAITMGQAAELLEVESARARIDELATQDGPSHQN